MHSHNAGELVTLLGEQPSLGIGPLLETHELDNKSACSIPVGDILRDSLAQENEILKLY